MWDQIKIIGDLTAEPRYDAHEILVAFHELVDLAQEHFGHEEEAMIDAAFPGMLLHQRDHAYLLRSLRDFIAALVDTAERPPSSLCDNLQSWFDFHRRRYDEVYLRFAEQRRTSGLTA
jgi:hemerythrin-like metal-binding protein